MMAKCGEPARKGPTVPPHPFKGVYHIGGESAVTAEMGPGSLGPR